MLPELHFRNFFSGNRRVIWWKKGFGVLGQSEPGNSLFCLGARLRRASPALLQAASPASLSLGFLLSVQGESQLGMLWALDVLSKP